MNSNKANHGAWIRTTLIYSAFLLWAAVTAAHLFFLQFDPQLSKHYRDSVAERWESYEFPQGKRGNILFRDGAVIACNRKVARVLVDPHLVGDVTAVSEILAGYLETPAEELAATIEAHRGRGVEVGRDVPLTTALALDHENLSGVYTRYYYERYYPHGAYGAAATVGYAGPQPVHRTGLEYTWDEHLRGQDGKIHFRKDARRKRLPGSELSIDAKQDGEDLTTTLDQAVQLICEDELRTAQERVNAEWACIIALEPDSGEIRAVATLPTYDPNEYARGNIGAEYNVIAHRIIEPGSTVKPLLAAPAIDRGWLNPDRCFVCNQQLSIDGKPLREAEASHVIGNSAGVPVSEIIIHSSNIGMARVALALGQDRVLESYRAMGFFRRTGVELPCECEGLEPYYYAQRSAGRDLRWPRRVVANAGFGQGLSVTPLQLARAYCVLANGGYLVQPTLIKTTQPAGAAPAPEHSLPPAFPAGEVLLADLSPHLTRQNGDTPASFGRPLAADPDTGRIRVLSPATCELVTGWLVEVVEEGTGRKAKLERYQAAGKTGTGQVASEHGGYQTGAYTATFVGYFPAQAPRYVVLVMFVHPRGGKYYGGDVAAPVFKQVCDRISYLDQLAAEDVADAA